MIKKKYEIEKHEDNKAFLAAHPEAIKEVRVSIPANTIEEIIGEGERLILDEGVEATAKIGHIATIVLTLLFVIGPPPWEVCSPTMTSGWMTQGTCV